MDYMHATGSGPFGLISVLDPHRELLWLFLRLMMVRIQAEQGLKFVVVCVMVQKREGEKSALCFL